MNSSLNDVLATTKTRVCNQIRQRETILQLNYIEIIAQVPNYYVPRVCFDGGRFQLVPVALHQPRESLLRPKLGHT